MSGICLGNILLNNQILLERKKFQKKQEAACDYFNQVRIDAIKSIEEEKRTDLCWVISNEDPLFNAIDTSPGRPLWSCLLLFLFYKPYWLGQDWCKPDYQLFENWAKENNLVIKWFLRGPYSSDWEIELHPRKGILPRYLGDEEIEK